MQSVERRFESISVKAVVIAILTVLMLWPLSRVETLISERQNLQHEAYAVIAAGFGGPQVVGAPVLSVETLQRTVSVDSSTRISTDLWTAGPTLHLASDDQAGAHGYSANWQVLELNRAIPQIWRGTSIDNSVLATAFGVRLLQPSDLYTQNYRAVRYGILFVAITFACFFAWEHLVRGIRLHPMQYLLVGLALATFYLLLLALSEHIGFALSYALAAGALVALISTYISGATNNRRAAAGIGAALAASYGLLYVILLSQDYALLFGSLLLFAVLAALMLATRRLDWANIRREESER